MGLVDTVTMQGNELVAVIGWLIIYLSLIWTGGTVLRALIHRHRTSD